MIAFIDLETGGFSKTKNGLCEVAVSITTPALEIVASCSHIIKPYLRDCETELVSYKPDAMAIHGITLERLQTEGTDITVALSEIFNLLEVHGVTTIAGHNVKTFDFPWLDYLFTRFLGCGISDLDKLDTLQLAKDTIAHHSYKLEHLCELLGIQNEAQHTAPGDVLATIELLRYLRDT